MPRSELDSNALSAHTLDEPALRSYLGDHLPSTGQLLSVTKLGGGQSNPTFMLTTETGLLILRRKPPGQLLESAHAIEREYRVMQALADTEVPVPEMHLLCEDESILGSAFFIMEYIPGHTLIAGDMKKLSSESAANVYTDMIRVLAAMHSLDVDQLGLADYGPRTNYFARQVARWASQYEKSRTEDVRQIDELIAWLEVNIPPDDGQFALVHGDYRLDNLIFHPAQDRLAAVIDWELSTLGHPLADLAFQCALWRLPPSSLAPGRLVLRAGEPQPIDEAEYVARYWAYRGQEPSPHWTFALAFCLFRLAAILQGVKKRAIEGNASGQRARAYAALIVPIANVAIEIIESDSASPIARRQNAS